MQDFSSKDKETWETAKEIVKEHKLRNPKMFSNYDWKLVSWVFDLMKKIRNSK